MCSRPTRAELLLRIPGDDVLEFLITGIWRGVQTGLCADGTGAGSAGNFSTATGATLASIAPSIAASLASLSSAVSASGSMMSALSGMSTSSQSSLLSVASDQELSPSEKKMLRHARQMARRKMKKKVHEGDPREEAELVLELDHLTPGPQARFRMRALLTALQQAGLHADCAALQTRYRAYLALVAAEEAEPMPTLAGLSEWQRESVCSYFNWPASSHDDEEITAQKIRKREEARREEKAKQERSQR
jgi:hypothetical protein